MKLVLNEPLDMHLHLRDGEMLDAIAPLSSKSFCGALIMPNLSSPVNSHKRVKNYKKSIISAIGKDSFTPYMTLFFKEYDYDFLKSIKNDILAIKLYPAGITTNSEDGVSNLNLEILRPTLEAMSDLGITLCVHGESDGFVMDREKEFCGIYEKLAINFPNLKIIMEHITTKESVSLLVKHKNLFATITLHHLLITLDDVAGGMLKPHLFCKPIAKHYEDRKELQRVALMAHDKVMFGSDSAPHPKSSKECPGCAAGIFTAPIALQMLAQFFEENEKLENLQAFVSDNAKKIYGIKPEKKEIVLEKKEFTIPEHYSGVVPMFAGKNINWSLAL